MLLMKKRKYCVFLWIVILKFNDDYSRSQASGTDQWTTYITIYCFKMSRTSALSLSLNAFYHIQNLNLYCMFLLYHPDTSHNLPVRGKLQLLLHPSTASH